MKGSNHMEAIDKIYKCLRNFKAMVREATDASSVSRIAVDTINVLLFTRDNSKDVDCGPFTDFAIKLIKIIVIGGVKSDGNFKAKDAPMNTLDLYSTREAIEDAILHNDIEAKDEIDKAYMGMLAMNVIDKIKEATYGEIYFMNDYIVASKNITTNIDEVTELIGKMLKTLLVDEYIVNEVVAGKKSEVTDDEKAIIKARANHSILMAAKAASDKIKRDIASLTKQSPVREISSK